LTVATSMLILVANVGSGIALARTLGPTGRGILTAAMLFGALIVSIGGLGIGEALVYRSGRAGNGKSPALVTALYMGAAQSVVLILVGWIIVPFLLRGRPHPTADLALAYLAIIPLYLLSQYPLAILQGRLRLVEFNLVRASTPIFYTAALFLLWRLGAMTVQRALIASLASFGVASALALGASARFSTWRASVAEAHQLVGYGVRSHIGNLAVIIGAQLDVLVLTASVSASNLGYYAVAISAAGIGSLIPTAASIVLFPTFANQSGEAVRRTLARFLLWGLGGAFVLGPVLVLLVPWAVVPVYGPAFAAAAAISQILVPGFLLRGGSLMLVAILRGSGTPLRASVGQIIGLLVLFTLLPIGISKFGPEGAAWAVTISAAAGFIWLLVTALKYGHMSYGYATEIWRSDFARLRPAPR